MKSKKYKIVSITQVFNEIEKDNLVRFFKYLKPVVDEIVIYDDCSTDGSYEYALENTNHVIRGFKNDFSNEINHRDILIKKALSLNPDFILWIDADEILSNGSEKTLINLCDKCIEEDYNGVQFHEINLWRSKTWKRTDSLFNDGWFTRLWKASSDLELKTDKKGLHQNLVPLQIDKVFKQNDSFFIHYGFSSKKNLAVKYLTYKKHGQSGYEGLERIIDERILKLQKVDKNIIPAELYEEEISPIKLDYLESRKYVESYRSLIEKPKYSIICLIYKSVNWLKLVNEQVNKYTDLSDKEFFFIANDANENVLSYLKNNFIKHYEYNAPFENKNDWYINNVYRAFNFGAEMAKGEYIVFINSDMCFSEGWFESLLRAYNGKNIVSSRLVESGRLKSGIYGIDKYFGSTPDNYEEDSFKLFANSIRTQKIKDGGLYMPIFLKKSNFIKIGGYPEGNLKAGADIFSKDYAKQGEDLISGDTILIEKYKTIGINHVTSFDSVIYHFQEGEMLDINNQLLSENEEIAVINDYCRGINNEKVFWNYLLEFLPGTYKIDYDEVGEKDFLVTAKNNLRKKTKIIIQNATFIERVSKNHFTILLLQDDLRGMGRTSKVQEENLYSADLIVTNSIQTSISYKEFDMKIIPIGVNENLFRPLDKINLRVKYGIKANKVGIFVGSFSEVKGWSKVKKCINERRDIFWIVVSKYDENFENENVMKFSNIDQEKLAELLNCADFFIIGSPIETQCLAALEANLCNLPVVMPKVGIFRDFKPSELGLLGEFGDDLMEGINRLDFSKYSPRKVILDKGFTIESTIKEWEKIIIESLIKVNNTNFIKHHKLKLNKSDLYKRLIIESFMSFKKYSDFKILAGAFIRKSKKLVKIILKKSKILKR